MFERVQRLEYRRLEVPRLVEVLSGDTWWPGLQFAWQLRDDLRGLMADVSWSRQHDWGLGRHVGMVPPERLRIRALE
ncbi:hypothetical protein ACI78V_06215 [Geodermatophilus sp. SYSU D00742]